MAFSLFLPTFLYMLGGLIVWGIRFLSVYSFTAIACARGWSEHALGGIGWLPLGIGLITFLSLLGCAALLAWSLRQLRAQPAGAAAGENAAFIHAVAGSAAGLALLAILWESLAVLIVPACV